MQFNKHQSRLVAKDERERTDRGEEIFARLIGVKTIWLRGIVGKRTCAFAKKKVEKRLRCKNIKVSWCEKSDYTMLEFKTTLVILFVDSDDTMPDKIVFSSPIPLVFEKQQEPTTF